MKSAIRAQMSAVLKKLARSEVISQSEQISQRLESFLPFKDASSCCIYMPMPREVDTRDILRSCEGKKVYVPKVLDGENMTMLSLKDDMWRDISTFPKNEWGIPEPLLVSEGGDEREVCETVGVDLIIVPGVAFTKHQHRLGHGKGYYDKYIHKLNKLGYNPVLVGICFDEQLIESIPCESHDYMLDAVVTPSAIYLKP
eukprot:TRINITY_DN779928_c0_g1_i1.p1 TRINITY_DN779928_c0_g1~~TRINITY_DN779928_c0_g1_i1.p1  ORF type:complete len:199 (-),score=27.06 TRINITY_DN779928_c0_g1_i1:94-690(-)